MGSGKRETSASITKSSPGRNQYGHNWMLWLESSRQPHRPRAQGVRHPQRRAKVQAADRQQTGEQNGEKRGMTRGLHGLATVAALGTALCAWDTACAQKRGGILRMYSIDSPASMSILEEATAYSQRPMMGVFNNLVVYDQAVKQNTLETIVPDLATGWSWNEDGTELTLPLHRGVKWHDGTSFTAQDVKCTWDLLTGKGDDKLRVNPRKSWYHNLVEVTSNGDYEIGVVRITNWWGRGAGGSLSHDRYLLPRPSLSPDRHPARRLAVSPVHPELPRCRGASRRARAR